MQTKYFLHYKMAIESLVAFAKACDFDADNGNFDELVNEWINSSKKQHEEILDKKDSVMNIIKAILK